MKKLQAGIKGARAAPALVGQAALQAWLKSEAESRLLSAMCSRLSTVRFSPVLQ